MNAPTPGAGSIPGSGPTVLTPEVLVIGGGPAGLAAAARLAPCVDGDVLVLDREAEAGGVPRHCAHGGFGLRDLRRSLTGPAYARRLRELAGRAGADLRTEAMVTGWVGDRRVEVTSPQGRFAVEARAVVLATGARERPRAARLIPGDRPAAGVYTTGQLQQLVHGTGPDHPPDHLPDHGRNPAVGRRAVVVGAELVSWSAVLTLRAAGCGTALMTTRYPRADAYAAFAVPGRLGLGVPVATRTQVVGIVGRDRVEAVEIQHLDTGARRRFSCDTVVLTGDWIPDHELARTAGLVLDGATLGPLVDTALRTSRPGVFAAGNLVHPVDTADVAALDGRHVADQVAEWLHGAPDPATDGIRLLPEAPLRWITPGLVRPGDPDPPRGRLLAWSEAFVRVPRVRVVQDGVVRAERTLPWPAAPGRAFRIPSSILTTLDPRGGAATLTIA